METIKRIGFSVGDTVKLLWLRQASSQNVNPKQLHDMYEQLFPGRTIAYDYVARLAKKLEKEGSLMMNLVHHRKYYSTTSIGKEKLKRYEDLYYGQFLEILKVINRMYYYLTKNGHKPEPVEYQLPQEFRPYFAKLISVKDITRHMIFSLGIHRTEFYIAEVIEQMEILFGWSPSNGYLYEIAREMEAEETIIGRWKDPQRRTIRLIKVTDEGVEFSKRIAADLTKQVQDVRKYLKSFILFFE